MDTARNNDDNITYHYINVGDGRVTVGYLPDNERGKKVRRFYYGISYCSLKDRFVKKKGRDKARGRLLQELEKPTNDRPHSGFAEFNMNENVGFYVQINEIVRNVVMQSEHSPRWFREQKKNQESAA